MARLILLSLAAGARAYRLGNIVDAWIRESVLDESPGAGAPVRRAHSAFLKGNCCACMAKFSPRNSFGRFLAARPPTAFLSPELRHEMKSRLNNTARWGSRWGGIQRGKWWIYSYRKGIKDLAWLAQPALRAAFDEYYSQPEHASVRHRAARMAKPYLAVHIRLGDFTMFKRWIAPSSIASAARRLLTTPPRRIVILGGGQHHLGNMKRFGIDMTPEAYRAAVEAKSRNLSATIRKAFEAEFPDAAVELLDEASVDADFYLLATAPLTVSGYGSYAMAAALANRHVRLSPGLKNSMSPGWERAERTPVVAGDKGLWRTFIGEHEAVPGS